MNLAISFFQALAHDILHIATTFGSEAFLNAIDDEKQALLDILIDNEFKDCVSHSNVQSYLSDLWNGRAAIIIKIGYPKYISKSAALKLLKSSKETFESATLLLLCFHNSHYFHFTYFYPVLHFI